MSKHTPTPWVARAEGQDLTTYTYAEGGKKMVNVRHPDNAAYIVLAVNAHAQLVEACLLAVNSDSFVRLNPNIQKYIREALTNATLTKEG